MLEWGGEGRGREDFGIMWMPSSPRQLNVFSGGPRYTLNLDSTRGQGSTSGLMKMCAKRLGERVRELGCESGVMSF